MSTMLAARPYTHFSSSEDRAATEPPELRGLRRDDVRLMIATAAGIRHTVFYRLADQLRAGDVLVVNTSATVPGELDGSRNGVAIVVHAEFNGQVVYDVPGQSARPDLWTCSIAQFPPGVVVKLFVTPRG